MARNLEIQSTFQITGDGLGSLVRSKSNRYEKVMDPIIPEDAILVKKNNFGIATLMSQSVFSSLDQEMKEMCESYASKKMASKINTGFKENQSRLTFAGSKINLESFEFNSNNSFAQGVKTKFCLSNGAHKGHMIVHVPAFIPIEELDVPEQATNFKLSARLISISDYERKGDSFELLNPIQHEQVGSYETTMLPMLRIPTEPITAQLSIANRGVLKANVSTVLVIGVKFYTYKNSKFSFMSDEGMMRVIKVN